MHILLNYKIHTYPIDAQLILPILFPFNPKKYNSYLEENEFIEPTAKHNLFLLYVYHRKLYTVLCRFIRRLKVPRNQEDMYLQPFGPTYTWTDISDRGIIYRFNYVDLIRLIMEALTHTQDWIHIPRKINNPYTGQPFTIPTLYQIYLSLHNSSYIIPTLFQHFIEDINLSRFSIQYDPIIREYHIQRTISMLPIHEKHTMIQEAIYHLKTYDSKKHQYIPILHLHPSLTQEQVVHAFEPMIIHYYKYLYSMSTLQQEQAKEYIQKKLLAFKKKNILFGKMNNGILYTTIHVPWNELDIENTRIPRATINNVTLFIQYN